VVTPSTEGGGVLAVEVPVHWLWAEAAAHDLIADCDGRVWPGTFEFRATRDVLALTVFLAGVDPMAGNLPVRCLEVLRDRLAVEHEWLTWCRSNLYPAAVVGRGDDMRLAREAWWWLRHGRLLALPTVDGQECGQFGCAAGEARGVGWARARHVVDRCLAGAG